MMMRTRTGVAALALALLPAIAAAQGTLSTRGLGFPGGQLSARSLGTGGALGEIDPLSPINPASIFSFGGTALYFQAEPEYRTLRVDTLSDRNTIARYPLTAAAVPIGESWMAGLSVSNLLDRSFQTSMRVSQVLSDTVVRSTSVFTSDGAIADVRLALAWAVKDWLRVGVAAHAITGDNELKLTQNFDDSSRYAAIVDTSTLTYTGTAFSTGVEINAGSLASFAASYRYGRAISLKHGDTTVRNGGARVPDRLSFSAAYVGVRGTAIVARASREGWSSLAPLLGAGERTSEGWDTSIGADVLGPSFLGAPWQVRAGARRRTLPFGVPAASGNSDPASRDVTETSWSVGAGRLLGRGRAALDLALVRAMREASATPVRESAWTLSVGLTVRP